MGKRKVKKEESGDEDYELGGPATVKAQPKKRACPAKKAKKEEPVDEGLPAIAGTSAEGVKHEDVKANTGKGKAVAADLVNEKRQVRWKWRPLIGIR